MALILGTCRRRDVGGTNILAKRLTQPFSVADVLTPAGTAAARRHAATDRAKRDQCALGTRPMLDDAHHQAGLVGTSLVDPETQPADPRLIAKFGSSLCLKHRVLQWRSTAGRVTILAVSPTHFLKVRDALTVIFCPVNLAIITSDDLDIALNKMCHSTLMLNSENRTMDAESCRDWNAGKAFRWGTAAILLMIGCMVLWPSASFLILCGWAVFILIMNTILKIAAAVFHIFPKPPRHVAAPLDPDDLPIVTLLVPLFRERDVAGAFVHRLLKLDYPSDRLDVCLVLEADDGTTQDALTKTQLPFWMRAIRVPLGTLQTKPRALNYALNFAKVSIMGVYDAEDAPAADQLHVVVNRLAHAALEVACLQGRLDFYNSHSNRLGRCFTVQYAIWFRIILPRLERLKLAISLGGTPLFFRRKTLEELDGWDAHNVTEDADLGIRLARQGYRTKIIDTVTQEEANARAWPWVKQRSRWLKGYAITYGVHMRNPMKLWKYLGV